MSLRGTECRSNLQRKSCQEVIHLAGDLIALAEEELAQQPAAGPEYAAEHPATETRFHQEE